VISQWGKKTRELARSLNGTNYIERRLNQCTTPRALARAIRKRASQNHPTMRRISTVLLAIGLFLLASGGSVEGELSAANNKKNKTPSTLRTCLDGRGGEREDVLRGVCRRCLQL
jgi:hypothetical protein